MRFSAKSIVFLGFALVATSSGQRAMALTVLDNTPSPVSVNSFAGPENPNNGNTYILSRGYAFSVANDNYVIDSVAGYLVDGAGGVQATARLELRNFVNGTVGQLLESSMITIPQSSSLNTFPVSSWLLSKGNAYWIGLNFAKPYNQGGSIANTSTWGIFNWSLGNTAPAMGADFAYLGYYSSFIGPSNPTTEYRLGTQLNSLRVSASLAAKVDVPAPLPVLGYSAAFAFSRRLRKRIRESKLPVASA